MIAIRITYDYVYCINYGDPDRNEDQRWIAVWWLPLSRSSKPTKFSLS